MLAAAAAAAADRLPSHFVRAPVSVQTPLVLQAARDARTDQRANARADDLADADPALEHGPPGPDVGEALHAAPTEDERNAFSHRQRLRLRVK
jgi:hypothetical protein